MPETVAAATHAGVLPMEPKEENVKKMKAWLLDRYAASAFNKQCPAPPVGGGEGAAG